MPYVITSAEHLDIDGVPMSTTGWAHENLYELWSGPSTRGQDRTLPGAAGVRAYRRRATATRRQVQLVVWGDWDWNGARQDDPREGLKANIEHLRTNVTDPTIENPGTRVATLHLPDGSTKAGAIHVESFELAPVNWFAVRAVLDITLVSGALT